MDMGGEEGAGLTAEQRQEAVIKRIKSQHVKLSKFRVEDCSGAVLAHDDVTTIHESDGRGHNCFFCERPITREGYHCREVKEALQVVFEKYRVPWEEFYNECERRLPLRAGRVGVPVGRSTDAGNPIDVVNDVCSHACSHAAIYEGRRANMSQQLALNLEQALKAGIDLTSLTVTAPRGWHERHGGRATFTTMTTTNKVRRRICAVNTQVFRRIAPTFVEEKFGSHHRRSRFEDFLIQRADNAKLAGNRPISPAGPEKDHRLEDLLKGQQSPVPSDTADLVKQLQARLSIGGGAGKPDPPQDDTSTADVGEEDTAPVAATKAPQKKKRRGEKKKKSKKKKKMNGQLFGRGIFE
jgi:hypothetical protein